MPIQMQVKVKENLHERAYYLIVVASSIIKHHPTFNCNEILRKKHFKKNEGKN